MLVDLSTEAGACLSSSTAVSSNDNLVVNVERSEGSADTVYVACPTRKTLYDEAVEYFVEQQSKCPDDKIPFVSDAQKMCYYLEKKEFPFLLNFEERRKKFEDVNYKKLDRCKVFRHMVAPASMYPKHYVDSAIENSSVLYGKDLAEPRGRYPSVKSVMDDRFFTIEEYVASMVELYKCPEQGYENLSKNYLNRKAELICRIIEAEKIVEQEELFRKEADVMLEAELARIAAVEAAKPKIMSVKVKPIPGVCNQGGTIVFGGGRTLLHIEEEVQELPSPSTWMERSGIMVSTTTSNISTATSKCGSNDVVNDESIGNSKFGDVDCAKKSSVATSNEKRNVVTSRVTPTNVSSVQDQSSSWGTPFVPSSSK